MFVLGKLYNPNNVYRLGVIEAQNGIARGLTVRKYVVNPKMGLGVDDVMLYAYTPQLFTNIQDMFFLGICAVCCII